MNSIVSIRFALAVALVWTAVVAGLYGWDERIEREHANDLAK